MMAKYRRETANKAEDSWLPVLGIKICGDLECCGVDPNICRQTKIQAELQATEN